MTKSQADALKWLQDRNGDGLFDKNGVVVAAGESAPFERKTWNRLRDMGLIEFYGKRPDGTGRGRLRISAASGAQA